MDKDLLLKTLIMLSAEVLKVAVATSFGSPPAQVLILDSNVRPGVAKAISLRSATTLPSLRLFKATSILNSRRLRNVVAEQSEVRALARTPGEANNSHKIANNIVCQAY